MSESRGKSTVNAAARAKLRHMSERVLQMRAESARKGALLTAIGDIARGRSIPEILRDLATKDAHDGDERNFLNRLLIAFSDGVDVRKALGIDPPGTGHRRKSRDSIFSQSLPLASYIAAEVRWRVEMDGDKLQDAIDAVSKIVNKSPGSVRKDYERGLPKTKKRTDKS